ncbi:MAG: hypothetical protein PF795_11990, partial [Kiritimatiellae bacterium]|nr:hypothetical protein [Kiritimatiellia bacterium]
MSLDGTPKFININNMGAVDFNAGENISSNLLERSTGTDDAETGGFRTFDNIIQINIVRVKIHIVQIDVENTSPGGSDHRGKGLIAGNEKVFPGVGGVGVDASGTVVTGNEVDSSCKGLTIGNVSADDDLITFIVPGGTGLVGGDGAAFNKLSVGGVNSDVECATSFITPDGFDFAGD